MTDYQFQRYEELRNENEALRREVAALRGKSGFPSENGMTDYQFRQFLELLYETLKTNFAAGKTQDEILSAFADLMKAPDPTV